VSIFPKLHKDWAKIVDFPLGHSDFKIAFFQNYDFNSLIFSNQFSLDNNATI